MRRSVQMIIVATLEDMSVAYRCVQSEQGVSADGVHLVSSGRGPERLGLWRWADGEAMRHWKLRQGTAGAQAGGLETEAIEEIREAVSDWKNATRDVLLLITHATP